MGYMAPSIIFINVNGRLDLTAVVISIPPAPFFSKFNIFIIKIKYNEKNSKIN